MKKFIFGLLSLFLIAGTLQAQDGKKALKKGAKLLTKYAANAIANGDQLEEGLKLISSAAMSDEVKGDLKLLNLLGSAYNSILEGQINAKILDPNFEIKNGDLAFKALDVVSNVLAKAEKKKHKKDAFKLLTALENHMNNLGIYAFQANDYANAFKYFKKAIDIYNMLKDNGQESRLNDDDARKEHYFYTGAAGYYGKVDPKEVIPVFEALVQEGTDKALTYEALFNLYKDIDKEKSVMYLNKGREMFPDDTGILFAEINYYLQEGKLDVLIDKLKLALEKEPDNVSIYTTLGNVYDQLNQSERKAGNIEKADQYFDEAMKYYTAAIEKDPKNFEATYSQGALYYNKAATYTDEINRLADDYSSAGLKKYEALKKEMDGYFDEALPYFEKAHQLNPNDMNTLIALGEIYARKEMFDKVKEIKAKKEALGQ